LYALNQDRYNERIIPLLRKPCDYAQLSWTLPEFQVLDLSGNFDVGCRTLLRVWDIDYQALVKLPGSSAKRKPKR
jgi:hypothetical protein